MPHIGNFPSVGYPSPLSIGPSAFVPRVDTQDWFVDVHRLRNSVTLEAQSFRGPLILPHGVTITKLTLYGYRDVAGAELTIGLYRGNLAISQQQMAIITADWTDGWGSKSTTAITYPVIDNNNYTYGFQLNIDPQAIVEDLMFSGVIVDWT